MAGFPILAAFVSHVAGLGRTITGSVSKEEACTEFLQSAKM
jgi:hypothetical protein